MSEQATPFVMRGAAVPVCTDELCEVPADIHAAAADPEALPVKE